MNTFIISTFSCTFEEFEKDISGFIKVLGVEVKEWDKKNSCNDSVYSIELVK